MHPLLLFSCRQGREYQPFITISQKRRVFQRHWDTKEDAHFSFSTLLIRYPHSSATSPAIKSIMGSCCSIRAAQPTGAGSPRAASAGCISMTRQGTFGERLSSLWAYLCSRPGRAVLHGGLSGEIIVRCRRWWSERLTISDRSTACYAV